MVKVGYLAPAGLSSEGFAQALGGTYAEFRALPVQERGQCVVFGEPIASRKLAVGKPWNPHAAFDVYRGIRLPEPE